MIASGVFLWFSLIFSTYIKLPVFRKLFEDFGVSLNPFSNFVLDYAPIGLPAVLFLAFVVLACVRTRAVVRVSLFWLPLVLIAGFYGALMPALLKLLNDLS